MQRRTKKRAPRTQGAQAVGRAVEVLRAVARCQRGGATLWKIMSVTELSRSTAFRLLRYLTEERLLEFDERQRCYYIGPLAYELGLAAKGPSAIASQWKDRIERLAAETGMTAYLVARSDLEIVCLATAHGSSVIRAVTLEAGQRLPLGVGAGSLAILSSLPDEEIDEILSANSAKLRMYGGGRLTPRILKERVQMTRAKGYALSTATVAEGVIGVGIAITDGSQLTPLALSVSLPATRLDAARQAWIAKEIRRHMID